MFLLLNLCPLCIAKEPPVKKGDTLVYRVQVEDQDPNGNIEVLNDSGEKIKVIRTTTQDSEKVESPDDGLIDGYQPKVGLKYDSGFSHTDDSGKDVPYYCYVEKKETVTVPAGTFKHCFKIVQERNTETETSWYSPGVGIVKYTYHHYGTFIDEIKELEKIVRA